MITITGISAIDWIIFVFLCLYVIYIIGQLLDVAKAKAENLRYEFVNAESKKINNTTEFFIILDYVIRHEIDKVLQSYALLGKKYEIINLDQDFIEIAQNVYASVEKEIMTNHSIIFTDAYIMSYISSRSRLLFFQSVMDYNRGNKQENNLPTS